MIRGFGVMVGETRVRRVRREDRRLMIRLSRMEDQFWAAFPAVNGNYSPLPAIYHLSQKIVDKLLSRDLSVLNVIKTLQDTL